MSVNGMAFIKKYARCSKKHKNEFCVCIGEKINLSTLNLTLIHFTRILQRTAFSFYVEKIKYSCNKYI